MYSQVNEFSADEVTHQSVNEQIKLATESILQLVERSCALLADRTDLTTGGTAKLPVHDVKTRPLAQWRTGMTRTTVRCKYSQYELNYRIHLGMSND